MDEKQTRKLLKFFDDNEISPYNQDIVIDYLRSIERIGRASATIGNNENFMRFLVTNVKTDLDKLTKRDVNNIEDAINDWVKKNGEPASASSKHLHKVMLRRFLVKYGKRIGNKEMVEAADFEFAKVKGIKLETEDILTEDEMEKIANACTSIRDKAMISLLYESGARVGEIEKLKIRDIKNHTYGFHVTLNGKTGKRQVVIHQCQDVLKMWLNAHPENNNPESPLFTTVKKYGEPHTYKPIRRHVIDSILKKAAKKAGIDNKRIYPHLLRHSQATRLANTLTEQQLKKRMGWTGGSTMAATYVHLADQDVDDAVLQSFGVDIVRDKKGNAIRKCSACGVPISAGLKFCSCGMPVTQEAAQMDIMLNEALVAYFTQRPEMQADLMKNILGLNK